MTQILIVEDDETTQFMMCELIETLGYECKVVGNGEACIDRLAMTDHGFDIVLLDLHMPGMNGLDAAQAIRAAEPKSAPSIPIVAVTADVAFHAPHAVTAYGLTDVLPKPIDLEALDLTIRKHAC